MKLNRFQMRELWSLPSATSMMAGMAFILLSSLPVIAQNPKWIATWTASPEAADIDTQEPLLALNDQTVRERVRISLGGTRLRLRLSNEFGNGPLSLGSVSVGVAHNKTDILSESIRQVTFNGKNTTVIPPGKALLSDPIKLSVPNGSELAISVYIPKPVTSVTWHSLALRDSVISEHGDQTRETSIRGNKTSPSSVILSQVLVPYRPDTRVIVAFGDSLVEGDKSTPESDCNWPSDLFRRLQRVRSDLSYSVVNEGIAGNRLLKNGPAPSLGIPGVTRFKRDALQVPGVTDIILLEGTNDIGFPGARAGDFLLAPQADAPTAEEIIGAYRQLIAQSHAQGIRIIGGTILPTEGAGFTNYHTEQKERTRQAVNSWIRTSNGFDGVIDFDAVMRDPKYPSRLIPSLASDDHIHPNDVGYRKMADSIDLSEFR